MAFSPTVCVVKGTKNVKAKLVVARRLRRVRRLSAASTGTPMSGFTITARRCPTGRSVCPTKCAEESVRATSVPRRVNALRCILAPTARDVRATTNVEAATAGPVNVSRRRATGHHAHRNKTVNAKRATAIARRETVTTSAAREARFGAARGPLETANPVSTIARAHWGTKPGYLSDPQF